MYVYLYSNKQKLKNEKAHKILTWFGNSLHPRARESDFIYHNGEANERYKQSLHKSLFSAEAKPFLLTLNYSYRQSHFLREIAHIWVDLLGL